MFADSVYGERINQEMDYEDALAKFAKPGEETYLLQNSVEGEMKNGNITDKELNSEKYMYESRTNKTTSTNASEGTNQTKAGNETKSVKAEEVKAKE